MKNTCPFYIVLQNLKVLCWWKTLWMDNLNLNEQKLRCAFFLTKVNIWISSRIVLMNFSPEFDFSNLGYIIHITEPYFIYVINSNLVNFTNHVRKNFFFHCTVLLSGIKSCNKYIFTWSQLIPVTRVRISRSQFAICKEFWQFVKKFLHFF